MRTPIRWVGVAVVTSAAVGGAAAMVYVPVSSSAATKAPAAARPAPDLVTPQITSLANQAQQLNSEIVSAQSELAHLKKQVSAEATIHYSAPRAAPVVRVQSPSVPPVTRTSPSETPSATPSGVMTITSTRPVTHTTTGASGGKEVENGDGSSGGSDSSNGGGDN
jgi:hypothetical protein